MMTIRQLEPSHYESFQSLGARVGNVFTSLEWAGGFGDAIRVYGIFDSNQRLAGGFYLYRTSVLGFPLSTTPPYTPSIGLFYEIRARNPAMRISAEKEILSQVAGFFRQQRWCIHRYGLPVVVRDMQPFTWAGFKAIPYYTYRIDLTCREETLTGNLSAKLRNNLRKAEADGLQVRRIEQYSQMEEAIYTILNRQHVACHKDVIRHLLYRFATPENSFAFATCLKETIYAIAFCVYDRETAYYLFGGTPEVKHEGAGALAVWESVKHARSLSLKWFDFEGSMIRGVEKFFRGFGGELVPYYSVNRAPLAVEMLLKLYRREIF